VRRSHRSRRTSGSAAGRGSRAPSGKPVHPRSRRCGVRPGFSVDRDGTLVRDVPYNGDPDLVEPLPGVAEALARVRAAGIAVAVVSNQSGVARGLLSAADVDAVNDRVEDLLGPFAGFFVCPHGAEDACACRKPMPELLLKRQPNSASNPLPAS
jgi:histidinol-phosphate phosphatase family protein